MHILFTNMKVMAEKRFLFTVLSLCSYIVFCSSQNPTPDQGVALYHIVISDGTVTNSVKLDNNSVIAFNDIDGLACSSASSEKVGRWQYPDGTAAMGQVQGNRGPFYVIQRGSGRIDLFRQSNLGGRYEGIYTCFIPDESGVAQTLYAGIYARPAPPHLDGLPVLNIETPFFAQSPMFTLTCNSSGFPPTTLTWTRDSEPLPADIMSDSHQVLIDARASTFANVLRVRNGRAGVYTCTVSNAGGENSVEIELRVPSEPPRNVTAVPRGNNSVEVSWSPPINSSRFLVRYDDTDPVLTTSSSVLLDGFLVDVVYNITVQALGELPGPVSNSVNITLSAPPPPTDVTVPALSPTSLSVEWNARDDDDDVIGYAVSFTPVEGSCDGIVGGAVVIEGGAVSSYVLQGLEEHTKYNIVVHSRGRQAKGLPSNPVTNRTESAVPLPPQMVTPRANYDNDVLSFTLSWDPVPCRDINDATITSYTVRFGLAGSAERSSKVVSDGTEITILEFGMRTLVVYVFEVAAVNRLGEGEFSSTVQDVLLEAPGPVNNFTVIEDIVSMVVTWEPPLEEKGRGFITEYEIIHRLSREGENPIAQKRVTMGTTSHRITNLIPDLTYELTVKALIEDFEGQSLKVVQSTNTIGQVLGVVVTLVNRTSVTVSWIPLNSQDIRSYRVFFSPAVLNAGTPSKRQQEGAGGTLDFHGNASSGVIGSLREGTRYQFQVVAMVVISGLEREGPMKSEITKSSVITVGNPQGLDSSMMAGVIIGVLAFFLILITFFIIAFFVWWRNRRGRFIVHKKGKYELQPKSPTTALPRLDFEPYIPVSKPIVQQLPKDIVAMEGERVSFRPKVSGSPAPTVAWYHDNAMVTADYATEIEEDGALVFICVELKHAGTYKYTVSNNAGSIQGQVQLKVYSEGEQGEQKLTNSNNSSGLETSNVAVTEFGQYVQGLHANMDSGFREQFHLLPNCEEEHSTKCGQSNENTKLNRFTNITAYDDNRVKLRPVGSSPGCQHDYINASYISGYFMSKKFIASQGPTESTVVDFWRLVWQQRIATIVMITNLREGGKEKCFRYWPETADTQDYGPFRVFLSGENIFGSYSIRTFHVNFTLKAQNPLKVVQYHFTSWPDHGVPAHAAPMLAFHRRIVSEHKSALGPLLIHCSAGVGRTGTFIAIDIATQQANGEDSIDVPAIITNLRGQRMKMVQTQEQYIFIHDALLESIMCGDTQIPPHDLKRSIQNLHRWNPNTGKSGFESQFHVLNLMSPKPEEEMCSSAERNMDRNRYTQYLPLDKQRVMLKAEYPDYIHATFINGYKHKRKFIISQGPLQNTSRDFWKMVYERNCGSIVMLSGMVEDDQDVCHKYWPTRGIEKYGSFEVCLLEQTMQDGFLERIYSVTDTGSGLPHRVSQFQVVNWDKHGVTFNMMAVLNIINHVDSLKRANQSGPIVVHCSDTVTRSAIFCSVSNAIECCKIERTVDIFQVLKTLRTQRPGAIPKVEQYQVIHDFLLYYIDNMSDFQIL